ncbi:MAG: kynureninase [Anaerolineales bacterium]|nr:kynureninase [Anaerolineales bacterium]MCB8952598.1 kynureninase [Ardenticatenales bacterium]
MFDLTLSEAMALDEQDDLAPFRQAFVIDDPDLIYLDGNSLGRLPRATVGLLQEMVTRQWGQRLIRSWNEGWFTLSRRVGEKIAGILHAHPDEIIIADSTSVNLYKLVVAALHARPGRHTIISDDLNFPSDLYIFQGARGNEHQLRILPSPDGIHGPVPALAAALDEDTALLSLSHTAFKSGYTYDMAAITALAHDVGALVLWDLSHSAGAVPVDLRGSGADLAVGCTYKYLNGGPGAPAFLFVRRDWQQTLQQPISGWFGQRNQFALGLAYEASGDITRFLTGTPPLLSLAAIEPGVDLLLDAGINRLRAKSMKQTEYLIAFWQAWLQPLGFTLNSPRDPARRGSHVSLGHAEAARIDRALIEEMNVLPDFRRPDNLRLGIAPLYTSYQDIFTAMTRLRQVVTDRLYEKYAPDMPAVT